MRWVCVDDECTKTTHRGKNYQREQMVVCTIFACTREELLTGGCRHQQQHIVQNNDRKRKQQ